MISWQVEMDGKQLGGAGAFSSFLQQGFLLPMLDVGAGELDEYGSFVYGRDDLLRLRRVIANWVDRIEPHVGKHMTVQTWSEGEGTLAVDELLGVLSSLDEMAQAALSTGAVLKFYGD
jgi:hypothetical protein